MWLSQHKHNSQLVNFTSFDEIISFPKVLDNVSGHSCGEEPAGNQLLKAGNMLKPEVAEEDSVGQVDLVPVVGVQPRPLVLWDLILQHELMDGLHGGPGGRGVGMHVVNKVLWIHYINLGQKLLFNDFCNSNGVFVVSSNLSDTIIWPSAESYEEILLESCIDVLRYFVSLSTDKHCLVVLHFRFRVAFPTIYWSH